MALSADTVWEIRAGGSTTGSAGFVTGASGTDYSQQDAVHSTRTDLVIDAVTNTKITSSADPFAADDVGNIINITAGTGFTVGYYEIVSVAAAVATLDRAVGTVGSTGGTGYLGGASTIPASSASGIFGAVVAGNIIWVKADAGYTLTGDTGATNDGTLTAVIRFNGYKTTRGDAATNEANRPNIDCGAYNLIFDDYWTVQDIDFQGDSTGLLLLDAGGRIIRCSANNDSGTANRTAIWGNIFTNGVMVGCKSTCANGYAYILRTDSSMFGCYAYDSASGIRASNMNNILLCNCVIDGCTIGIDFTSNAHHMRFFNLTIDSCTTGISCASGGNNLGVNCTLSNCTTGISYASEKSSNIYEYCNFNSNTSDTSNVTASSLRNSLAVNPSFTSAAGGDFEPSNGNLDAGFPFPGGTSKDWHVGAISYPYVAAGGGGNSNLLAGKL